MNKWRIAGLIVAAALAGWLVLRSCTPVEQPAATPPPVPPREVFHASKPLRIELVSTANTGGNEWLERELSFVLARGKMRIAPRGIADTTAFVLRVELPEQPTSAVARVALLAPDGFIERHTDVPLETQSRLATVQSLIRGLPQFLGATTATTDWQTLIGVADAGAYESFLQVAGALLDRSAHGFTQPTHSRELANRVEQLETLIRDQPRFARAQGLLAIAYLGLGGEDHASLTQIADATAKRALALDDDLADAHSALGLARLRRGEWIAAKERFDAALAIDANAAPALEGLACLLTEVGQMTAALPVAEHAVAVQPGNIGAHECLLYARLATASAGDEEKNGDASGNNIAIARINALAALLSGDVPAAERALSGAAGENGNGWIKPLLRAATDHAATPEALRAVTRAASDGQIDAATEVMCGAALRQAEFVFNRMSRLQKQNEVMPLSILWLPQTAFLRRHRRFEQVVTGADLGSYWQEHGRPDSCEKEPQVYGCTLRPSAGSVGAKQSIIKR